RRAADGTYRWHLVRAVPFRAEDGGIRKWYGTSTDMHDLKRAEEQRRLLTDASAILGGSLEYEQALERVAGLAVHELADWCVFGVLENGQVRHVAACHADPTRADLLRELLGRHAALDESPLRLG